MHKDIKVKPQSRPLGGTTGSREKWIWVAGSRQLVSAEYLHDSCEKLSKIILIAFFKTLLSKFLISQTTDFEVRLKN